MCLSIEIRFIKFQNYSHIIVNKTFSLGGSCQNYGKCSKINVYAHNKKLILKVFRPELNIFIRTAIIPVF